MLKTTSTTNNRIPLKPVDNSSFLTLDAKLAFLQLKQAFTIVPIFHDFDLERYI